MLGGPLTRRQVQSTRASTSEPDVDMVEPQFTNPRTGQNSFDTDRHHRRAFAHNRSDRLGAMDTRYLCRKNGEEALARHDCRKRGMVGLSGTACRLIKVAVLALPDGRCRKRSAQTDKEQLCQQYSKTTVARLRQRGRLKRAIGWKCLDLAVERPGQADYLIVFRRPAHCENG